MIEIVSVDEESNDGSHAVFYVTLLDTAVPSTRVVLMHYDLELDLMSTFTTLSDQEMDALQGDRYLRAEIRESVMAERDAMRDAAEAAERLRKKQLDAERAKKLLSVN